MTIAAIDYQLLANAGFPPKSFEPGETIFAEGDRGEEIVCDPQRRSGGRT